MSFGGCGWERSWASTRHLARRSVGVLSSEELALGSSWSAVDRDVARRLGAAVDAGLQRPSLLAGHSVAFPPGRSGLMCLMCRLSFGDRAGLAVSACLRFASSVAVANGVTSACWIAKSGLAVCVVFPACWPVRLLQVAQVSPPGPLRPWGPRPTSPRLRRRCPPLWCRLLQLRPCRPARCRRPRGLLQSPLLPPPCRWWAMPVCGATCGLPVAVSGG